MRRGGDSEPTWKPYLFLFFALVFSSCGANDSILKSGKETPVPATADTYATPVEQDIEAMRTARFTVIFVLRRKDAGMIDNDDRRVIRSNTGDANRRVSADGGRAFVIGSNFQLQTVNMAALYERFLVEDYSPPMAPGAVVTVNTNAAPKPGAKTNTNATPKPGANTNLNADIKKGEKANK